MEPEAITMLRDNEIQTRCPGDGEESFLLHNQSLISSYNKSTKSFTKRQKLLLKQTPTISKNNLNTTSQNQQGNDSSFSLSTSTMSLADSTNLSQYFPDLSSTLETSQHDLHITIDALKTKLKLCEEHNSQLIEEKMRLSQQLGIQTQVNNEVKKLLVASIGEDLEEKYERLIQDKTQVDLEVTHLRNVMEEDREEVEQAMIQADVWRSKFLASRVMNDELARWKSALYYKYRESHSALQSLLEEHSKIRALNNSTRRGLVSLTDLLQHKDPSLDSTNQPLTTIDVAFMNNDLVTSLVEVTSEDIENKHSVTEMIEIKDSVKETHKRLTNNKNKEFCVEANELTPAEQLAHEVVINTSIRTDELTRMRRDYLAHNRISHFLSTNYQVTFNCCENCSGKIQVV